MGSPVSRKEPKKSHHVDRRPPFEVIALLLQGGGALGSYQAGVYQALAEADLHPDWVAGISIGAHQQRDHRRQRARAARRAAGRVLGDDHHRPGLALAGKHPAAVPAGQPRARRLQPDELGHQPAARPAGLLRAAHAAAAPAGAGLAGATSWYDTGALRTTLERLVDFDRINAGEMRFTVGAVNVRTGNLACFDNETPHHPARARHGQRLAAAGLPGDRDRRRASTGTAAWSRTRRSTG